MSRTLQSQIDILSKLYSRRNAMYIRGEMPFIFLVDAVRVLGKLIRRSDTDPQKIGGALASVFSRMWSFANTFQELPLVEALSQKYPLSGCAYGCGTVPCSCPPDRKNEITLSTTTSEQLGWNIEQWCQHFDRLFGKENKNRGLVSAFQRLNEEVAETVGIQLIDIHDRKFSLSELRMRVAHEFADVFAWTCAIANLCQINLAEEIEKRYGTVCRRCHFCPCDCGPYYWYRLRMDSREDIVETLPSDKKEP